LAGVGVVRPPVELAIEDDDSCREWLGGVMEPESERPLSERDASGRRGSESLLDDGSVEEREPGPRRCERPACGTTCE
jgi:hypothetical protein